MAPLVSRVLVALVGLPLVLLIVWAGGWWLFALAGVAAVLALHEYALMIRSLRPVILAAYAGALLSLVGAHLGGLEWTVAGFLSTMVLAFLLHWIATTRQSATVAIASTVLGAGWVGLCLAHLLLLRQIPSQGELATFTVLLAVWAGDIGAFFAGRLIGGPKLAPRISPKKTWAGLIGAMVSAGLVGATAALVGVIADVSVPGAPSAAALAAAGAALAVVAQAGDLGESWVKRRFGAKDSSGLIPGHGGLLDRVDGLLAAAVALAAWQWLSSGGGVLSWR